MPVLHCSPDTYASIRVTGIGCQLCNTAAAWSRQYNIQQVCFCISTMCVLFCLCCTDEMLLLPLTHACMLARHRVTLILIRCTLILACDCFTAPLRQPSLLRPAAAICFTITQEAIMTTRPQREDSPPCYCKHLQQLALRQHAQRQVGRSHLVQLGCWEACPQPARCANNHHHSKRIHVCILSAWNGIFLYIYNAAVH